MRIALRTTPLLVIGFALIGCGKDSGGSSPARLPSRADQARTETTSDLPMVTLEIPGMF